MPDSAQARVSVDLAALDGAEDHLDAQSEKYQVQLHLCGDDQASGFGLGRDVTESDGGEGRDRQVDPSDRVSSSVRGEAMLAAFGVQP
jgi:hypothetical protein